MPSRIQSTPRSSFRTMAIAVTLTVLLSMFGCKGGDGKKGQSDDEQANRIHPELDGAQVRDRMLTTYRQATAYADKATLHLSYQLQGSYLEEPHPWQVQFGRNLGLNIDSYKTRVRAAKTGMGCFIYDFGSGNLDDQWKIVPYEKMQSGVPPIEKLFEDGICRHYINGHNDIPTNKDLPIAATALFPPTPALLSGTNLPDWIAKSSVKRRDDVAKGKTTWMQIELSHEGLSWQVTVDPDSFLIQSIRYPNQLLDQQLQGNPDVDNLLIEARFTGATLRPAGINQDTFTVGIPAKAKQVQQFVAVPEPFPSSHIGLAARDLVLYDSTGKELSFAALKGKPTLLWWMGDGEDVTGLKELAAIGKTFPQEEYNIGRVRCVHNQLPNNQQVYTRLKKEVEQSEIPLFADFGFSGGKTIGLQHYPVLAVLDREGTLQFVKAIDTKKSITADELKALMARIQAGDDIASEMRKDYQAFLDLYHERLDEVSWNVRSNGILTPHQYQVEKATGDRKNPIPTFDVGSSLQDPSKSTMISTLSWTNDTDLKQPGNIAVNRRGNGAMLSALDGWRTIVQLDKSGKQIKRRVLDLEPKESISSISGANSGNNPESWQLVYSKMGNAVRVIDSELKIIKLIESENEQQQILHAALMDANNDRSLEAVVSFSGSRGTVAFSIDEDQSFPILREPNRSFSSIKTSGGKTGFVFVDGESKLRFASLPGTANQLVTTSAIKTGLVAVTKVASGIDAKGNSVFCAVGVNDERQWQAVGFDHQLKKVWTTEIGEQRFESQIASIRFAQAAGDSRGLWAIATAQNSIEFVGQDGELFSPLRLDHSISGVEFYVEDGSYKLVVSSDKALACWTLEPKTRSMVKSASVIRTYDSKSDGDRIIGKAAYLGTGIVLPQMANGDEPPTFGVGPSITPEELENRHPWTSPCLETPAFHR